MEIDANPTDVAAVTRDQLGGQIATAVAVAAKRAEWQAGTAVLQLLDAAVAITREPPADPAAGTVDLFA